MPYSKLTDEQLGCIAELVSARMRAVNEYADLAAGARGWPIGDLGEWRRRTAEAAARCEGLEIAIREMERAFGVDREKLATAAASRPSVDTEAPRTSRLNELLESRLRDSREKDSKAVDGTEKLLLS